MTDSRKSLNRREFLSYLSLGWVAFTAACAGLASLAFRYSYPNVNFDPEMEFLAGRPDDYEEGVDERWKNGFGVWIVKEEGRLFALSNICTHLGCIPNCNLRSLSSNALVMALVITQTELTSKAQLRDLLKGTKLD